MLWTAGVRPKDSINPEKTEVLLFTRKRKIEEVVKTRIARCEAEPDKGG